MMTGLLYKGFFKSNIVIEIALFSYVEASYVKDLNDRGAIPVLE